MIKNLNEQQKEAVTYFGSPLLILAGAGSGKTRVITYKIAYMVKELGFEPKRILAVTFTNKAAKEMKERVEGLLGRTANVNIYTFHAFCVRLLKSHSSRLGYKPNFLIYDSNDKKKLIVKILNELNVDRNCYSPAVISSVISNIKNGMSSVDSARLKYGEIDEILEIYQRRLKDANAFDFDDLLIYGEKLLHEEDINENYRNYFKYVLVDEYQDTNKVQYNIIKLLTLKEGNVCVVGDEDQCIYTWRGANINNILDFEREFKNTKVIKLERNYRSTSTILKAANSLIKNNNMRKGKSLYTDNPEGESIRLLKARNDREEARYVADSIEHLLSNGAKPSDVAVFYRTNAQSRLFEDALRQRSIPYKLVGSLRFYERKEVKDVIAYLRASLFDEDRVSIFRILNVPKRGLGQAVERKFESMLGKGLNVKDALAEVANNLNASRKQSVLALLNILNEIKQKSNALEPYKLIRAIVVLTDYENYIKGEFPDDFQSRMENINELANTLQEFSERNNLKGEELFLEFLNSIALSSDQDEIDDSDAVMLMTIHASKGLEFPVVFITGLEENLFPHARSIGSAEGIEEERRLFYVAITRAKKLLSLSYSAKRRYFGTYKETEKSRFINEIPMNLVRMVNRKPKPNRPTAAKKPRLVFHEKFGKGVVKSIDGIGANAKVVAVFENYGEKTIIRKFLKVIF